MDSEAKEKLVDTLLTPGLRAVAAIIGSRVILGEDGNLPIFGMSVPLTGNALSMIPNNYKTEAIERCLLIPVLTGSADLALGYAAIPTMI